MRARMRFTELYRIAPGQRFLLSCGCRCRTTGEVTQPSGDGVLEVEQACQWHPGWKARVEWLGTIVTCLVDADLDSSSSAAGSERRLVQPPPYSGYRLAQNLDVTRFLGSWKITYMERWGQDYVDLVVPGHLTFESDDDHLLGSFQFGTVVGRMDCRVGDNQDLRTVQWSWQGQNDCDPGCGRGWARLEGNKLTGRLFIHAGDDSQFQASRQSALSGHRRWPPPTTEAGTISLSRDQLAIRRIGPEPNTSRPADLVRG